LRITRIENQKRRSGRKSIYADGKFLAGVDAETLARLALRTGDTLSEEQLRSLHQTEELIAAKNAALRLLATRPRTEREIRNRLRRNDVPDALITRVTEELKAAGLLDDAEFARLYIRDALTLRPAGGRHLRQKLLQFGVDRETIEDAMQECTRGADFREETMKAARQYIRRHRSERIAPDNMQLKKRLAAFLQRRGFSWDDITPTVDQILEKESVDDNE
jgi:regulatory protein